MSCSVAPVGSVNSLGSTGPIFVGSVAPVGSVVSEFGLSKYKELSEGKFKTSKEKILFKIPYIKIPNFKIPNILNKQFNLFIVENPTIEIK